jgi:hypothetical protein
VPAPLVPAPAPALPASSPSSTTPPLPSPTAAAPTPPTRTTQPSPPGFWRSYLNHLRTDPAARLWFGMCMVLIIFVHIVVAPSLGFLFTAAAYSAFWFPQIARTARRGRPSGLSWEYLLGTTACRLFFALCKFVLVYGFSGRLMPGRA